MLISSFSRAGAPSQRASRHLPWVRFPTGKAQPDLVCSVGTDMLEALDSRGNSLSSTLAAGAPRAQEAQRLRLLRLEPRHRESTLPRRDPRLGQCPDPEARRDVASP